MTVHELDDGFGGGPGACREHTHTHTLLRDDEDPVPTGWIRGHTKIDAGVEVKVTYHSDRHGIEVRVKSLKNESISWIVISRGMKKCVEEVQEEKGESVHHKEMASGSGTETPFATKHKGQSSPLSNLVSKMFVPINLRKRNDILAVDHVGKKILAMASLGE